MCGRVKLEGDFSQLKVLFGIPDDYPAPNYAPSWNVAPTDSLPIVRYSPKDGHRALDLMRWGLVPYWAKSLKVGASAINAMAETVDVKSMFRKAFAQRRCLVHETNAISSVSGIATPFDARSGAPTTVRLLLGLALCLLGRT
jgi:putative SOS response-associated peptidase YedK